MTPENQQLLHSFVTEAEEQLDSFEQGLLMLDARPDDAELVGVVFRSIHTLKGNAAVAGAVGVQEVAHAVEDVLAAMRAGEIRLTPAHVTHLLRAVDLLRSMVRAASEGQFDAPQDADALIGDLSGLTGANGGESEDFIFIPADTSQEGTPRRASLGAARAQALRVDLALLDELMNLTGELTVAAERVTRALAELEGKGMRTVRPVRRVQDESETLLAKMRDTVTRLRMVPMEPIFRSYGRLVRDVAHELGKEVKVLVDAESTTLDTSVVDELRGPLTHLIRNALDHGIEAPGDRIAAGKPSEGRITLRARQEGGSVEIAVSDDGRGLVRDRIVAVGVERGLVSPGASLTEAQVIDLLFQPGFSTAEAVSHVSGRGVGLDVVKAGVERFRGSVNVRSDEGRGTTFTLRVPLTLTLVDGIRVRAGDSVYIIPMHAVGECVDLGDNEGAKGHKGGVLNLRGAPTPYLRLRDLFDQDGDRPSREQALVLHEAGMSAGIVVDAIEGYGQALIRPLGPLFQRSQFVAGSAMLNDGRLGLIVNVGSLLRKALGGAASLSNDVRGPAVAVPDA